MSYLTAGYAMIAEEKIEWEMREGMTLAFVTLSGSSVLQSVLHVLIFWSQSEGLSFGPLHIHL